MRRNSKGRRVWAAVLGLALVIALPAHGQLGGLRGAVGGVASGLPQIPASGLPALRGVDPLLGDVTHDAQALVQARLDRISQLLKDHPTELDHDDQGNPTVRGQILAISPSDATVAAAQKLGFTVISHAPSNLGFDVVTLGAPARARPDQALRQLRKADPQGQYDFNHIYMDAGVMGAPLSSSTPPMGGPPVHIGLIDTGANAAHPAFAQIEVRQQGFTAGGVRPADHGTGVAGLAAGGKAGSQVLVADVYGGQPTGGATDAVVRALGWMGQQGTPVVNISLVGPPNIVLQAAVHALTQRGVLIVAAVGNDGPAAPPAYPASFPEVIAVTGVDKTGRIMLEAGHALHVDFAALGVDVGAAQATGGYSKVRGTSFASPVVAAALARLHAAMSPADAQAAIQKLSVQAKHQGSKGRDKTYGYGIIGP